MKFHIAQRSTFFQACRQDKQVYPTIPTRSTQALALQALTDDFARLAASS
eukprot:m.131010 g.131010  ORF g.131010 m.131010 type:complete len:50 (-) comp13741_c0_seq1:3907-4056(-)